MKNNIIDKEVKHEIEPLEEKPTVVPATSKNKKKRSGLINLDSAVEEDREIKEKASKEEADDLKAKLEEAGGSVEIK